MISAKKLLLAAGGPAKPFTLSGSWDNVQDGWTFGEGVRFSTTRRSGTHAINPSLPSGAATGVVTRRLLRREYLGLRLSMQAYARQTAGSNDTVSFGYLNAQGSEVTVSTHEISGTTVFQLCQSPSFPLDPVGSADLTLFIRFQNQSIHVDDWQISGVKP